MIARPRGLDAIDRFGEAVAERASPMVVKEVRQGLRTRSFWVFFTLLLIACIIGALVAFASSSSSEAGAGAFIAFFSVLSIVQFFVIPFTAYRSMAREQDDETWVLLTLTGLGPRRVILGKIASFVLQGALYASAAAPFLLFSYFLNGIGLPTILLSMLFAGAYQVFLVSIAVSIASAAHTKLMRAVLQFAMLAILFHALIFGIGGAAGLGEVLKRGSLSTQFAFGSGCLMFGMLSTAALLFESAAAGLSLSSENYSRGPRIAFLVQIIGGTLLFVAGSKVLRSQEVLAAGAVMLSLYTVLIGTYIAADLDGLASVLESRRSSVLSSGAYRGFILVCVSLVCCAAVFLVLASLEDDVRLRDIRLILGAPGFALLYLSLPQLLGRALPRGATPPHVMVRIVSLALILIASGLPPLLGALFSEPDDEWLNALNPAIGLINLAKHEDKFVAHLTLIWGAATASALSALAVLKRNDR